MYSSMQPSQSELGAVQVEQFELLAQSKHNLCSWVLNYVCITPQTCEIRSASGEILIAPFANKLH